MRSLGTHQSKQNTQLQQLPSHHYRNKISVIVTDLHTYYASPYVHTTHNTFTFTMSHPMSTLHTKLLLTNHEMHASIMHF